MLETEQIVALWRRARFRGETAYLATVVHVEGSSYRKPGARMLVTSGGERAGTLSGGCLEAEICRRIAWLTGSGPALECYRSSFDDDNEGVPYGLGCGGTIWILMESGAGAHAVLEALEHSVDELEPSLIVSALGSGHTGTVAVLGGPDLLPRFTSSDDTGAPLAEAVLDAAHRAMLEGRCVSVPGDDGAFLPAFLCAPVSLPPRITIFGAGDDAQPIVRFAGELGWRITVADGRSHLLRRERFPQAAELRLLGYDSPEEPAAGIPDPPPLRRLTTPTGVRPGEMAAILTHSYDQDRALLEALLPEPLLYLGVLGPRHRTERLLASVAPALGLSVEQCFARLHSPVGLNLGPGEPSIVALAIVAEMQAILRGREVHVTVPEPPEQDSRSAEPAAMAVGPHRS